MKMLFSTVFLVFAVAQIAGADEHACTRVIGQHDVWGKNAESVYCENTAQAGTQCERVITGHDARGNNLYIVSCSDNSGSWYNVSADGLTDSESQRILDKIDLQMQYGH
jgi:hypothetical protein